MAKMIDVIADTLIPSQDMRGSRKFCQRCSNFDNVLLEDPNTTISGPSSDRANDCPKLYAGLAALWFSARGSGPVLIRNPIFFVMFQGMGREPWIRT